MGRVGLARWTRRPRFMALCLVVASCIRMADLAADDPEHLDKASLVAEHLAQSDKALLAAENKAGSDKAFLADRLL